MKNKQTFFATVLILIITVTAIVSFFTIRAEPEPNTKDQLDTVGAEELPLIEETETVTKDTLSPEPGFDIAVYKDCDLGIKFPTTLQPGYKGNLRGFFYDKRNRSAFIDMIIGAPGSKNNSFESVLCYDKTVDHEKAIAVKTKELAGIADNTEWSVINTSEGCEEIGLLDTSCNIISSEMVTYKATNIFGEEIQGYILSAAGRTYVFDNKIAGVEYQFSSVERISPTVRLAATADEDYAGTTLLYAF